SGSDPGGDQRQYRSASADGEADGVRQRSAVDDWTNDPAGARPECRAAPPDPDHLFLDGVKPLEHPFKTDQPGLTAAGIRKAVDRGQALAGADIELRVGEVPGLLVANGGGKLTLSKIISGHVRRDSGEIRYKGKPLDYRSTREALDAGIAIVMQ